MNRFYMRFCVCRLICYVRPRQSKKTTKNRQRYGKARLYKTSRLSHHLYVVFICNIKLRKFESFSTLWPALLLEKDFFLAGGNNFSFDFRPQATVISASDQALEGGEGSKFRWSKYGQLLQLSSSMQISSSVGTDSDTKVNRSFQWIQKSHTLPICHSQK